MEKTLVMIKPNGVKNNLIGEVISRFEKSGLKVVKMEMKTLTRQKATRFYAEHKGKHFFDGLLKIMTSGPIVCMAIEGKNAISAVREIVGATNPKEALAGTIRFDYAPNTTENVIHASDSTKSATREIRFHFGKTDSAGKGL